MNPIPCPPLLHFLHSASVCVHHGHAGESGSHLLVKRPRPSMLHSRGGGSGSILSDAITLKAALTSFSPLDETDFLSSKEKEVKCIMQGNGSLSAAAVLWAELHLLLLEWKKAPFGQQREGGCCRACRMLVSNKLLPLPPPLLCKRSGMLCFESSKKS